MSRTMSRFPEAGDQGEPLSKAVRGLIASESAFRELLESAPDGIVISDSVGRIVLVNRQAEVLFGYQRHELLGHKVEMLLPERHGAAHERHRASYQQSPRTRPMGIDLQLSGRRPDASEFPVEISLSPITLEGSSLVIATIRDVSERKRLEREKDDLLASLKHILDGVSDAIVALDADGTVVRVNPAGCVLFGARERDLVGKPAPDVFRWEDETGRLLEQHEYAFHETVRTGGLVTVSDRYLRRADGGRVPVTVNSAMVTDVAPDSQLVVQVVRDISR
ncbi:MAG: PAS domain-containing protein, partial [Chloroflexota bacterium]